MIYSPFAEHFDSLSRMCVVCVCCVCGVVCCVFVCCVCVVFACVFSSGACQVELGAVHSRAGALGGDSERGDAALGLAQPQGTAWGPLALAVVVRTRQTNSRKLLPTWPHGTKSSKGVLGASSSAWGRAWL